MLGNDRYKYSKQHMSENHPFEGCQLSIKGDFHKTVHTLAHKLTYAMRCSKMLIIRWWLHLLLEISQTIVTNISIFLCLRISAYMQYLMKPLRLSAFPLTTQSLCPVFSDCSVSYYARFTVFLCLHSTQDPSSTDSFQHALKV